MKLPMFIRKRTGPPLSMLLLTVMERLILSFQKAGFTREEAWERIKGNDEERNKALLACFDMIWPWEYDV